MINLPHHKHIIFNHNILLNSRLVMYVKVEDKNGLLFGKDKQVLIQIMKFEENSFLANGFIKISSQIYVNADYITAINLKTLNIELDNDIHLSYNKESETKLQAYIATLC